MAIQKLTINEEKLLELKKYGYTGYPSLDQPWNKQYIQEELTKEREKRTVFQEIYTNNNHYLQELAIEFFGTKISYDVLFNKIESTAKAFKEYGIKKGDFVTICAAGVPETVYSFYALSKIGAVANMMASYFDKNELVERIEDCESDVLIVMDKFYPEIKESIKKSRIKTIIILPTLNSSLMRFVSKNFKLEKHSKELYWNQFIKDGKHQTPQEAIAYEKNLPLAVVYSSGTTGAAKGILLSNDSFQNSIQAYPASGLDISRGQKFYQIIPPWFSTGLSSSIHLPLSYGCSIFMDPRFERKVFVNNIIKNKPNYTIAPTSMYEGFLEDKLVKNKDLSFFNYPFEGGEPLSKETANKIETVFREHGSDTKLRVAYGQCECGAAVTTQTQKMVHEEGSVGIPLPGITIAIFDDENKELPYYERGHILANTPCSMIGYYKNEEATNKYFFYDKNGTKWNRTGDIGYITENGELFIQGRADDYTVVNNKKIYNFDIEKIIAKQTGIKICDVLPFLDKDGNENLALHIILEENIQAKLDEENDEKIQFLHSLQQRIYEETDDIDMVPSYFKIRQSFPYAKSGKRDISKIKAETNDFYYLDKNEILKNIKQKVK
jgi:long-chain acyl-CoA synthetase